MKIIDVNILIYAVDRDSQYHSKVLPWWESALNGDEPIGLAWITLLGFVRMSTNPKVFAKPLATMDALRFVEKWLDHPTTVVVGEAEDHWSRVGDLLKQVGTAGDLTTDAHLAAIAISYDATTASCDADFAKFPGLRWENPLAS